MNNFPEQSKFTLAFKDLDLEREFLASYDKSVRYPLFMGIIISLLSWYSAIPLIYAVIPDQLLWLGSFTVVYIGSYFGFIIYVTHRRKLEGYYHLLGAISNAWAGLYTIYFCSFFPNGQHLILPVIIFIIFFGSYMIRLRWLAGFIAALSYVLSFQVYLIYFSGLPPSQVLLYSFVSIMVLVFAVLAGRTAEDNYRIAYIQSKTIKAQNAIIESEKDALLKEVHHRVQNNLQVIISLINLQLMKLHHGDDQNQIQLTVKEELNQIQSRILSMSQVHQRIYQSSNFSLIVLDDYIKHLIESIKNQYSGREVEVEITIDNSILIEIDDAISFGLVLNEMFLGAFTKAKNEKQQIKLHAHVNSDFKRVLLVRNETSPFDENHQDSLEFELIDALVEQLDGKMEWKNEGGAVYRIEF